MYNSRLTKSYLNNKRKCSFENSNTLIRVISTIIFPCKINTCTTTTR